MFSIRENKSGFSRTRIDPLKMMDFPTLTKRTGLFPFKGILDVHFSLISIIILEANREMILAMSNQDLHCLPVLFVCLI